MAPFTVRIGKRQYPVDIPLLVVGLILIFFTQQIATYFQAKASELTSVGEVLILIGAVFFIFGRINLKLR